MRKEKCGQVIIECPNTIFHLKIDNEEQLTKVHIFMNNIKHLESMELKDIYNWCNRQHVEYSTSFNHNRNRSISRTIGAFVFYFSKKLKYLYSTTDYSKEA